MDSDLFLQQLRDLRLEDGRAYIQAHAAELEEHAAFGNLLANETLDQLYTNPSVSLKLAELLVYFGEYVHHVPSRALGLKAKGDVLRVLGLHQAAIECLDAAGEEFLRLDDERNWASTRISYILGSAWLGHVEEALQEARRAHEVFQRLGDKYWACIVDHNTAYVYEQMGRYQDALKVYESILAIYPTLTDKNEVLIKRAIAVTKCNQAIDLALLGNFEEAYHIQQQSHAIFIALNEISCVINTQMNLADLDYTQGYYGSALRRYYHARDILTQNNVDDPLVLAELKLWMAKCLVKLNKAQEAYPLADEAVEIHRKLGTSLQTSNALREYATTLIASGRSQKALSVLEEAWTLFNIGGLEHYASITKLQQVELMLEIGFFAEAYEQARLLEKYFETQGLASRSVRAKLVMAGALMENALRPGINEEKEQQATLLQNAMLLCKQVALQAHQQNLQEEAYKSHYLLGRLFAIQENPNKAARHYGAAIAQIECILNDLVYDLSPAFLRTTWSVYEDMIALCLEQEQVERAFSYLEQARSMALRQYLNKSSALQSKSNDPEDVTSPSILQMNSAVVLRTQYELKEWQERYRDYSNLLADPSLSSDIDREVIQAELKRCEAMLSELFERLHLYQSNTDFTSHKKKRATHNINRVDITQLRQQLTPDQTLLAYFLHKDKLVIFAAATETLATYEIPDGAAQLERLLPLLHAHLQPGGWPDIQRPPQKIISRLLKKLYDLLIAPVTSLLPAQSGYLTIVPYGPLHKLPFHALYDGSHFLIENFQISYLPASNMLMHLGSRQSEDASHLTDLHVSAKRPLIFGYSGNGHLQRTIDEAKMLAEMLDGHCYIEDEATITRLIEQAPGSPIIHIATHGQSRLDAPNFSYVLLADGQLNAIDAFSLDLKGCELITLSGCETGLSLSGGGDEQLGLGRAFLAAGAESLVMSLWSVEDHATNELMQYFYHRLLSGDTKVQALRAAQCSLLHSNSSMYTHPYFWAAFRLVGGTGTLHSWKTKEPLFRD